MLSQLPPEIGGEALEVEKLYDAVDLILSLQVLYIIYSRKLTSF